MKKYAFSILLLLILGNYLCGFPAVSSTLQDTSEQTSELPILWSPEWHIGDWWIVHILANSKLIRSGPVKWHGLMRWKYEVVDIKSLKIEEHYIGSDGQSKTLNDEIECFLVVAQTLDRIDNLHANLYYQKDNLLLKRVEQFPFQTRPPFIETFNIFSATPILSHDHVVLYSFPVFPLEISSTSNPFITYYKRKKAPDRYYGSADIAKQSVLKINTNKAHNIIFESFPNEYRNITTVTKEIIPGETVKNPSSEIFAQCTALSNLEGDCYYVELEKGDRTIKQIWNIKTPWPIYSETEYEISYLGEYSYSRKKE